MLTQAANVPATQTATQLPDVQRRFSEFTVDRGKLKAGLPITGLPENFRMPLENERRITAVVRKTVAAALLRGTKTLTLATLLDPKLDLRISVQVFDKKIGRRVDKQVPARDEIVRSQMLLYGELMGKGARSETVVFLPLLNEKSTPAKAPLTEAIQNCHVSVQGGKPLPKLSIVWVGVDDDGQGK